jgi:alpha-1,3-glucosyltransferase
MPMVSCISVGVRMCRHLSRGFESTEGKNFMRLSVLLCDAVVFIPAVVLCVRHAAAEAEAHKQSKASTSTSTSTSSKKHIALLLLALLAPPLMLIDNGHFQYNNVCLGLSLWAIVMLLRQQDFVASVLFCLALNFKQMGLYYAPVFFFALLSNCFHKKTALGGLIHLIKIGIAVISTFVSLWLPFCLHHSADSTCADSVLQVLHRLFPFARGIFEDKVANLWYVASVAFDFRGKLPQAALVKLALALTLLLLAPTAAVLLRRRKVSLDSAALALVASSLAFFLCSFQVHEKSILLSTVPATIYFASDPVFVGWFQILGSFTMFPLLQKDGQSTPYFAAQMIFVVLILSYFDDSIPAKQPPASGEYSCLVS